MSLKRIAKLIGGSATVVGSVDGEGGTASGLWSISSQANFQALGTWPKPILDKYLYAWGYPDGGGGLGTDSIIRRSSPTQVGSLSNWKTIAAGAVHTVSIKTDGTMWSWGSGNSGKLGLGISPDYRSSPVQIGAVSTWNKVASGAYHTMAIRTAGSLWAWGSDGGDKGNLGQNAIGNKSTPTAVGALTTWLSVAGGNYFTAATKTDGTLWTWGKNWPDGTLGLNYVTLYAHESSPIQVGTLSNWLSVFAGDSHCIAIKTDGTLWGWGYNASGQIGDNSNVRRSSPVQVGALTNWQTISGGTGLTRAIKTDGTLWTWGGNGQGALGVGNVTTFSSPVQVGALTTWRAVGGGSGSTLAIKTDGTMWSWGYNLHGMLGINNIVSTSSPVQVGALTSWTAVGQSYADMMFARSTIPD